MASEKRTIRVFYSSPFRGLEREREMLSAIYWPRISQSCASKGITFVPIDFRWGITEESSMAANTVNICLQEVTTSDIFIGFFGARYGWHGETDSNLQAAIDKAIGVYPWLENYRDRSVTELEFLEGRLLDERTRPAAFFFRSEEYDRKMFESLQNSDPKEAKVYTSAIDGTGSEEKLQRLKESVHAKVESRSEDISVQNYATPEDGAMAMYEATMKILEQTFFNQGEVKQLTKFEGWVKGQSAYMATQHSLGSEYLGRAEERRELEELISREDIWRVVLKGDEGTGKTALLINHILEHREKDQTLLYVYYSMNAYPGANSSLSCLQFLAGVLLQETDKSKSGDEPLKISDLSELLQNISSYCACLSDEGNRKVVFVLDEIDRIESQKTMDIPLGFLPKRLPVKLVVSTKLSDSFHLPAIEEGEGVSSLGLVNLKTHEAMAALDSVLKVRGKSLNQTCLQTIENCPQICNFLFLKVLLEQLFSHAQFSSLEAEVKDLCERSSIRELFESFLEKLEKVMNYQPDYKQGSASEALCFLVLSKNGLMETEIRDLVQWDSRLWATFFASVKPALLETRGNLSVQYSHLRDAIHQQFLSDEARQIHLRRALADYFWDEFEKARKSSGSLTNKTRLPYRIVEELPSALQSAGMLERLLECLLDIKFFWTVQKSATSDVKGSNVRVTVGMQSYEYAKFLRNATDDIPAIVKEFKKNVEEDIISFVCRKYGVGLRRDISKVNLHVESLQMFYDCIDDGLGMPGLGSELLELAINIQRGIMNKHRKENNKNKAVQEEIFLSELFTRAAIGCSYQNRHDESVRYLNKSLAIKKTHRGRTDIIKDIETRIGSTLHTLGNTYKSLKKIDLAIPCFEQACTIHKENNSDNQWSSLDGLASCYFFQQNFPKAEELYRQVVNHFEKTAIATYDNQFAAFLCNLANAVRRNKKLDEARVLYQKAWNIQSKLLGDTHHSIAITLLCLGNLELASGDFEASANYFEKAYHCYKKTIGLICHETALAAENLAIALSKLGDFERGTPWFHHGGELLEKLGLLHMTMGWMNRKYLKYHQDKGNEEECKKILIRMEKAGISPPS